VADGTVPDASTDDGAVNDGSVADGAVNDGTAADSSMPDGSVADGSVTSDGEATDAEPTDASDGSVADADAAPDVAAPPPDCDAGGPAGNLVANWSFECGTGHWYLWSSSPVTMTATDGTAHSGTYSAVVTGRLHSYDGPVQVVPVSEGQYYSASAYAKVSFDGGPASETVNITLKYTCSGADAATYTQLATLSAVSAEWAQVTGAPVQVMCTPSPVELYIEGPDAGVDLYVDDVVLQQQAAQQDD